MSFVGARYATGVGEGQQPDDALPAAQAAPAPASLADAVTLWRTVGGRVRDRRREWSPWSWKEEAEAEYGRLYAAYLPTVARRGLGRFSDFRPTTALNIV